MAAALVTTRRFLPPRSVEEQPACFVVRDHNGQQLAYVYFEDEPGRRSAAKLRSKGEARRSGFYAFLNMNAICNREMISDANSSAPCSS
jgi:hypothetical protein